MQPKLKSSIPELTVTETASLYGCSEQYIRLQLSNGAISGEKRLNERNRPVYYIPLSALEPKVQERYWNKDNSKPKVQKEIVNKPLERYSENERQQIHFWIELIEKWQEFRNNDYHTNKAEADDNFIAYAKVAYFQKYFDIYEKSITISLRSLYRKWEFYKDNNLDGLIEKRGKHIKGTTQMDSMVWDVFLSYYLDQSEHPVTQCIKYTKQYIRSECPELYLSIPHYSSFYRRIQIDIPEPVKVLGREGEKAYQDRCAPYIKRIYDDMESNDYWVADTHTFDIMSQDEDGAVHRLYLTAFFDARSGIFTGCTVTDTPGSQPVLNALRKGILKYGIPRNIYVDNGREFLTCDVGGLGHRRKKKKVETYEPPAIFKRLGITMVNAKVRNARAKIIERRFLDVKNQLSRLFSTYTGGNVLEKPEKLKHVLKKGDIPLDTELIRKVELLLDWEFNQQEYHGAVMKDHGKIRQQVFYDNLHSQRVAGIDELNLMLMRSSRPQKVKRRGIYHKVGTTKIDYYNQELVNIMFNQEVYYRYDPENLSSIRVYDLEDRFLLEVEADSETIVKYGCSQSEIKAASKKIADIVKANKTALKNSGLAAYDRISALDLVLADAREKEANHQFVNTAPKITELQRVQERPMLEKAVGFDIDTMLKNAEKRHLEGGNNIE